MFRQGTYLLLMMSVILVAMRTLYWATGRGYTDFAETIFNTLTSSYLVAYASMHIACSIVSLIYGHCTFALNTGHVVFEMAAGYELTRVRPGEAEYKTVDKNVRPILKYIFEEGFPHSISEVTAK